MTAESVNGVEILYRDAQLLAVNKPSMLLSVPGRGPEKRDSVAWRIQQALPQARIIHRLDWETSGVMLLALDADSHRAVSGQFEQRQTGKRYEAVVEGPLREERFEIEQPLRCDWENRPRQIVDPELGKWALTRGEVIRQEADRTRVALYPVTGRSHQLRVHLQALGHPILGDSLYASATGRHMAPRLLLHATELTLTHPATGERLSIHSPAPF